MGKVQARKKQHRSNEKAVFKKTKRRTRDLDQVWDDTRPEQAEKTMQEKTVLDEDLPGLGQYYCITCARYFSNDSSLKEHHKTKTHKKR